MGARVTRCSGNATGAQRRAYSRSAGLRRRFDPLQRKEQRVPRLYWGAMRGQDPLLSPSCCPLTLPMPTPQQEHRELPRAPHALLQRILLDPFVLQVQLEFLQGLPHEFLEERVVEEGLHLHGGLLRLDGHATAGYDSFMARRPGLIAIPEDRKSTRLNSSHRTISYAVFCLKKKNSTYVQSIILLLLLLSVVIIFFFIGKATTKIYTLSLHDALPISGLAP